MLSEEEKKRILDRIHEDNVRILSSWAEKAVCKDLLHAFWADAVLSAEQVKKIDAEDGIFFNEAMREASNKATRAIWAARKREGRRKKRIAFSLDEPFTLPGGVEVSRHETVADPAISFEASEIRILLEQFRETLPDVERDVFDLLLAGERGKDIADELGRTQGRISQIRKKLRQRWEIQFPD